MVLNLGLTAAVNLRPGLRDPLFDLAEERFRERIATTDDHPITIAFLGSSRTGGGIRPAVVQELVEAQTGRKCIAYNLHVPGNGPVGELVHWNRLLDRGAKPDVVVIEITPPRFASDNGEPDEASLLHGDRLTRPEVRLVRGYGFKPDIETEYWEANLNPWSGFRFQLLARVEPKWLPPGIVQHRADIGETGGWGPWDPVPPAIRAQRVEEVKQAYGSQLHAIRFEGPHVQAFEELLGECRRDGVKVIVVAPPEGSEFRSWYPPAVQEKLAAFEERLRREFGVPVIDAREWLPDEAFADSHHVLRAWAGPYTKRLARDAVVPEVMGGGK